MLALATVACAGGLVYWLSGGVELSLALQPVSKLKHNTAASGVIILFFILESSFLYSIEYAIRIPP